MIRSFLLLSIGLISFASAGVSLRIEHPRDPSSQLDLYKVECEKSCEFEISSLKSGKATSESDILKTKISELIHSPIPEAFNKSSRRVLYKIEGSDGEKKVKLELGYPKSYKGKEFKKYSNTISLIEEIKRAMDLEIAGKKP